MEEINVKKNVFLLVRSLKYRELKFDEHVNNPVKKLVKNLMLLFVLHLS